MYEKIKDQAIKAYKAKLLDTKDDEIATLKTEVASLKQSNMVLTESVKNMGDKVENSTTLLNDALLALQAQLSDMNAYDNKPRGEKLKMKGEMKEQSKLKGVVIDERKAKLKGQVVEVEKQSEDQSSAQFDYYIPKVVQTSQQQDAPFFKNVLVGAKLQEDGDSKVYHDLAFLEFLKALRMKVNNSHFDYI